MTHPNSTPEPMNSESMSVGTLLMELKAKGLMTEEVSAKQFLEGSLLETSSTARQPLYIVPLLFFGAIFSTIFFLLFLLLYIPEIFNNIFFMGLLFVVGAVLLNKMLDLGTSTGQIFLQQVSLVLMILGKVFFVIGSHEYLYWEFNTIWSIPLTILVITASTYHLYPSSLDRFVSSCAVLFSSLVCLFSTFYAGIWDSILLHSFFFVQLGILVFMLVYKNSVIRFAGEQADKQTSKLLDKQAGKLQGKQVSKSGNEYMPIAYASIFSLAATILLFTNYPGDFFGLVRTQSTLHLLSINMLFMCALFFLMFKIVCDWRKMENSDRIVFIGGLVILSYISTPGILFSIVLLVLGHAGRNRLISFLGAIFLVIFLTTYYSFLDITFLEKAGTLVGSGIMLLLARYYILRQNSMKADDPTGSPSPIEKIDKIGKQKIAMSMRIKVVLLCAILFFGGFNYMIYAKEQLKQEGETILLHLAPVDPRSLMQGDYMALSYDIEGKASSALYALIEESDSANTPTYEYMVISLDAQSVGQFVRFYDGENLAKNERLFAFKKIFRRVHINPDSFFFQEGHAKYYEDAEYGVFKYDSAGEHLLIGLADASQKLIIPPKGNVLDSSKK